MKTYPYIILLVITILSCQQPVEEEKDVDDTLLSKYAEFSLKTNIEGLSSNEQKMIPLLIKAADIMNDLFWQQAYGDKEKLLVGIQDENQREFARINYGPWDRLDGNKPFIAGVESKPLGANFYPSDVTKEDIETAAPAIRDLYTMVRRSDDGSLSAIPYNEYFNDGLIEASQLLQDAADIAEDDGFKKYLMLRADAFLNNDYYESDLAWMDMKDNHLDLVIGPIETYEDQLIGAKASFEAYVLVKDKSWSERLKKYAALLPVLQEGLPVDAKYKAEVPGTDSELNAYDVIYYAGDCNSGSKTIAINLPNDERVQLSKGTRRLQLKNAMKAKFDKILIPIANELLEPELSKHITFDAFFGNTMFHEVAHGLGIKNLVDGEGTVRQSLKEQASALEEGKADILGLYMIDKMAELGEFPKEQLMDNFVTFLASIFRSSRFGTSSAHGRANMLRFNFFEEKGAFSYSEATGKYSIDFDKMKEAMKELSNLILTIQGNGDYKGISELMDDKGKMSQSLQNALDRVNEKGIPVDIIFDQGPSVLGLDMRYTQDE